MVRKSKKVPMKRQEVAMGDGGMASEGKEEAVPAPAPGLAAAFQAAWEAFLVKKGKAPVVVDFSTCKNGGKAFRAATDRCPEYEDDGNLLNLFQAAVADLNKKPEATTPTEPVEALAAAFESEYIGDAHKRLYDYLEACWERHCLQCTKYSYPCIELVQSSGFGKSRLLHELATHFRTLHSDETRIRRMVYVNMRNADPGSKPYPPRTSALASYFFPQQTVGNDTVLVEELAQKLVHVYSFIMQPDPRAADARNVEIEMHDKLMALFSGKDEQFVRALKACRAATTLMPPELNKQRLMVLAIDGSRALLPERDAKTIGWFRIVRRALEKANATIRYRRREPHSAIFVIFVDTISKVYNVVNEPSVRDPSRRTPSKELILFPPFVLTDTIDVHRAAVINTQGDVVPDPERAAMSTPICTSVTWSRR